MNFKEQLERDIKTVFHDCAEFAEMKRVRYAGSEYTIPVILDSEDAKDRKKPSTDNADGIFMVDAVLYAAFSDLGVVPRKGARIVVDGDDFEIMTVGNECGELVLGLGRLDE